MVGNSVHGGWLCTDNPVAKQGLLATPTSWALVTMRSKRHCFVLNVGWGLLVRNTQKVWTSIIGISSRKAPDACNGGAAILQPGVAFQSKRTDEQQCSLLTPSQKQAADAIDLSCTVHLCGVQVA